MTEKEIETALDVISEVAKQAIRLTEIRMFDDAVECWGLARSIAWKLNETTGLVSHLFLEARLTVDDTPGSPPQDATGKDSAATDAATADATDGNSPASA